MREHGGGGGGGDIGGDDGSDSGSGGSSSGDCRGGRRWHCLHKEAVSLWRLSYTVASSCIDKSVSQSGTLSTGLHQRTLYTAHK